MQIHLQNTPDLLTNYIRCSCAY